MFDDVGENLLPAFKHLCCWGLHLFVAHCDRGWTLLLKIKFYS